MTPSPNTPLAVVRQGHVLSVERHGNGWAIKHGNGFLGSTADLADALAIMATLADHTPGPSKFHTAGRRRAA